MLILRLISSSTRNSGKPNEGKEKPIEETPPSSGEEPGSTLVCKDGDWGMDGFLGYL